MERMLEEHISTADIARDATQQGNAVAPLLPQDQVQQFQSRWAAIQNGFVDEPRNAVHQADELVAQAIKHIAETFATARAGLEEQWDRGDNVSTEDLRVALQKYRTFFQRLLAV